MHGQINNTAGVSLHTAILCLFGHACNDFAGTVYSLVVKLTHLKQAEKKEIKVLS